MIRPFRLAYPEVFAFLLGLAALSGCSGENRALESDQPQTPPHGADDPRATKYEQNSYQISQGGRYFTWYGCEACHGTDATGVSNLEDTQWRFGGAFDQIYQSIAQGRGSAMPSYGAKIPVEQLWQITAYVRQLQNTKPAMIRRQDLDQQGEPQGNSWSGPMR
jgi:mono/diheme cytochrome c family protein